MKLKRIVLTSLLVVTTAGCWHQTVTTGLSPGSTVVDKSMVPTLFWGLVPGQVDVSTDCPAGIAIVETEQSIVNWLVAAVTFGIYSTRHVKVTCAAGSASLPARALQINVASGASAEERAAAMQDAVKLSLEHDQTVVVRF
jgi:hypothetical protein